MARSRLVTARESLPERRRAFRVQREVWQAWRKDFLHWQASFLEERLCAAHAELDEAERQQLRLGLQALKLLGDSDRPNVC